MNNIDLLCSLLTFILLPTAFYYSITYNHNEKKKPQTTIGNMLLRWYIDLHQKINKTLNLP